MTFPDPTDTHQCLMSPPQNCRPKSCQSATASSIRLEGIPAANEQP
jgi:hypothetical protein